MSKQVDERVVSLQFDNKRFESNVSQSMSTLDKLKQKLNLKGASKGLEEVNTAAKKVDMNGLAKGVDTVSARFSAMDVIGVTALANITNSAVNAGKQILSALTIDPVKTGLQEYETKMNAIQVIKANTRSKYTDEIQQMADIEKALSRLNDYADRTIYNYTQMTNNVGKFVAQGLGIDEAVNAVQGMANLAGASGATAEDMARATYQMSQALSSTIRMKDWMSLMTSNMATTELKTVLSDLARVEGIDIDGMLAEKGSFEQTLEKGWLSGDLFTKAMNIYSDAYSEAELAAMGFNEAQIKNFKDLAKTAQEATTEVKTMSQLWDVLKETAQSGWTQTWELIFGDFNEAKKMFTSLQNYFSGIINKMSDFRNMVLGGALNMGGIWGNIKTKLSNSGLGQIVETVDKVKNAAHDLKYFQDVFNKVWRGDYNNHGDNPDRYDLLDKAGYDHRVIQDLVNLGKETRGAYTLTMEDVEASHKKFGLTMDNTSESVKETTKSIAELSDEQLKNAGLTDEEISMYRALCKEADKLGISVDDLVDKMSKNDGRSLLVDSIKNLWDAVSGSFKAMKQAWVEIFNPPGAGELAIKLYGIIERFKQFTEKLRLTDAATGKLNENGDKLRRTFKGLFAILDLIFTIVGGPIKIAFKILSKILGAFDLNLLDLTAIVGDAIVGFHDWLMGLLDFNKIFEWLVPHIQDAVEAIKEWVEETKPLEKIAGFFSKLGSAIKKAFVAFKNSEAFETGKNIIAGLWQGIQNGSGKLWETITNVVNKLIEKAKEILGIHSPSVVFAAIGGFIVSGLLIGLKDGFPAVWDSITGFFGNIISFIRSIDWGAIITTAFAAGFMIIGNKMSNALVSFASMFEGIGDFLEGIGVGLGKLFKAKAWEARSKALLNFAFAIAVLAASVYILAKLDAGQLWGAIGAIAALSVILVALTLAVAKLNDAGKLNIDKTGLSVSKMTTQIIPIAASLLLVAIALKQLAGLSIGDIAKGGIAIAALGGILVGLMAATKIVGSGFDTVGSTLLKISLSILLLTFVVKQIAKMDGAALAKGIGVMVLFGYFIVGLIAATKLAGNNVVGLGATILGISAAILLLVFTAKIIGRMDLEALGKGIVGIAMFELLIAGLILITRLFGGNGVAKIGGTILAISVAMLLMAGTASILGRMDVGSLTKGMIAIKLFSTIISRLVMSVGMYGKQVKGLAWTILAVSFAIGILAGVAVLLGLVDVGHLAKGIIAVGILAAIMSMLIKSLKGAQDIKGSLIAMTVAIAVLAAAVAGLSFIDPANLAVATGALSAVIGMFALLIFTAKSLKNVGSIIAPLSLMVGVVVILAGVIAALAVLNVNAALQTTAGLALLMLSMSASLVILSVVGKFTKDALLGVVALLAMAVPLLAFVGILALMQNIQNATANAMTLTLLATAMTLLLIPLTLVGAAAMSGIPFLGVAALLSMAIPLVAFVGILALMQNIQNATENANLLIALTTAMTKVLVVLAIVGPLALVGVTAMTALSGLMLALGALAVGIGALMEKFPALQSFLNTGIPVLVQLAGGIGQMLGAFVGGALAGLTAGLPSIGKNLSDFMTNATPFIDGAKMIDESAKTGIGILVEAILLLSLANFIEGIASILSFGGTFADLGTQLSLFMTNALPFIIGASMIKPEIMDGVKTLTEAIVTLTAANLIDSITSFLGGGSSLADFGSQLGALGTSLSEFVTNLGTFTPDQVTAVKCAGEAITALSDAASNIPREGGWIASILGENSLATFGSKLPQLGLDLAGFITNLGTFGDDKVAVVDCAGKAINALAEAAGEIPNEGGFWAKLAGDNSLATFGSKLPQLGTDLAGFITNLGTFDESHIATVDCAGKAIKALADAASKIPNEGGFWAKLAGDNSLATFGSKLPQLGTDLAGFVTELGTFDAGKIATVDSACKAIKHIASLGKIDLNDTSSGLGSLGSKLKSFAKKIKEFVEAMGKVDANSLSSSITKMKDLIALAQTAADVNVSSLKTFGDSLKSVAEDGVQGFVDTFTAKDLVAKVKKAAQDLLDAFIKAAEEKKGDVEKAFESIAQAAAKKVGTKSIKTDFKQAGKDLVSGFASGISAQTFEAEAKAKAMAEAAAKAAKEALAINSPSKVFRAIGMSVPEGFAMGIVKLGGAVKASSVEMADTAINSTRYAMASIVDAINGDMDMQPSIRPVLDLTDVRSGVNNIGSMLSGTRTLAVNAAGIGAISANMSEIQNGRNNGDIVSAIKALRKDMANMPRESVTINGITYDDGSNIVGAVESLVRAAKIERRI